MALIPLFVSLPPSMSRPGPDGVDIGPDYARDCVRSWKSDGFAPITINSANESPMQLDGVERQTIERDAAADFEKSVPYFSDFLAKIAQYDGVIAITNADVLFRFAPGDLDRIRNLAPDECIVLNRQDIVRADDTTGEVYAYGFDFIACHASAFRNLSVKQLAIGIPWWDHFLPLWFKFSGFKSAALKGQIMHLVHEERWDKKHWLMVGAEFESILSDSLQGPTAQAHGFGQYMDRIHDHRAKEQASPDTNPRNASVSKTNLAEIEEWRQATP